MKLTKEHIGKMVWHDLGPEEEAGLVVAVGDELAILKAQHGEYSAFADGDWGFVEEPKKPSERIREIISYGGNFEMDDYPLGTQIKAMIKFLDEQFEAKK